MFRYEMGQAGQEGFPKKMDKKRKVVVVTTYESNFNPISYSFNHYSTPKLLIP